MGINLYWQNEKGEKLAQLLDGNFLVSKFLPGVEARDFPCLRFVDPAGDTVFNQAQIQQLILELEGLARQRKFRSAVQEHLEAVLEFVRQAVGETHTYINFVGD